VKTRAQRLRDLEMRLRWAAAGFPGVKGASQIGVVQQAAAAVLKFIEAEPGWDGLGQPFRQLVVALNELEQGQTVDWLEPKRVAKPGISPRIAMLRGRVVSIMHLLKNRGGMKMDDAARLVLDRLGLASAILAGQLEEPQIWTVREWCRLPNERHSPQREGYQT
jgi:hypothetical protein